MLCQELRINSLYKVTVPLTKHNNRAERIRAVIRSFQFNIFLIPDFHETQDDRHFAAA